VLLPLENFPVKVLPDHLRRPMETPIIKHEKDKLSIQTTNGQQFRTVKGR